MGPSIVWYDLETFGLDPRYDRIAQFACLRTDLALNPIEEPVMLYCRPSFDYLPAPAACKVHGITPQTAYEMGVSEYDFARAVLKVFSAPATTVAGFNSVHFDDEFVRNLFYRNLFEPYEREYANGNSRWDVINLLRAARDLRPGGIVWPTESDGTPIFKLEALAKANGVGHDAAHDALSDIKATIGMAGLVRSTNKRLYDWFFSHRMRESLKPLIDLPSRGMLLHTAAEYTSPKGCTTLIAPVGIDPENRNQLIAIDLRFDPGELLTLSVDEIRVRVFAKAEERTEPRVPLSRIKLNQCPFLAPPSTLTKEAAQRLGLDVAECGRRLAVIADNPGLVQKLIAVFDEAPPAGEEADPDAALYSGGFFPDSDREKLRKIHERIDAARGNSPSAGSIQPEAVLAEVKAESLDLRFRDGRIPRLLRRLFARNFPETLSPRERLKWREFCLGKIQLPPRQGAAELSDYARLVESELSDPNLPAPTRAIVHALVEWKSFVEREVLHYE